MSQSDSFRVEARQNLRLAVPTMVTGLASKLFGLVDTIMVGPLGPEALAAVSLGGGLIHTATVSLTGILGAVTPLAAEARGRGARGPAGDHLWTALWIGLAGGLLLALAFATSGLWVHRLDQEPAVARLAVEYMVARSLGIVAHMVAYAHRCFLYGLGQTAPVTRVTVLGNILNVPLNRLFIAGGLGFPALGVSGAAWATTVLEIGVAWATVALARRARDEEPARVRVPTREGLETLVRLGAPLSAQHVAEVGAFTLLALFAGWMGPTTLAAHHVTFQLITVTFMVPLGISTAACVRVAEARGRGDAGAARRAAETAMALGAGTMAVAGILFLALPHALVRAFSPDPRVIALAAELLTIAALFQIFDGLQIAAAGSLRGAQETKSAFLAHLLGYWALGIPVGYALAFPGGLGVHGLWWGITLSLGSIGIALAYRALKRIPRA